jgi:hypothetical protein
VNGGSSIHRVAHAREPLSVNLGRVSQNQSLMTPAQPFHMDPAHVMGVVSAGLGSALMKVAGNDTITQLESIAR